MAQKSFFRCSVNGRGLCVVRAEGAGKARAALREEYGRSAEPIEVSDEYETLREASASIGGGNNGAFFDAAEDRWMGSEDGKPLLPSWAQFLLPPEMCGINQSVRDASELERYLGREVRLQAEANPAKTLSSGRRPSAVSRT